MFQTCAYCIKPKNHKLLVSFFKMFHCSAYWHYLCASESMHHATFKLLQMGIIQCNFGSSQVISLGFDMDKASEEVETLEKEKAEKDAREEKRSIRYQKQKENQDTFFEHLLHACRSLKWARNRLPTFIRSPSNTKQRGGKKNGKRQSSEDRTADEEEVKLFKASGEKKTVKQKPNLSKGQGSRVGRAPRLAGVLWLLPLPWYH